jgi:hypothetical protein
MPRRTATQNDAPPTGKRAKKKWVDDRKRDAERAYSAALATGMAREAEIFRNAAEQLIDHENPAFFEAIGQLNKIPVTIDEFIDSPEFLGCDTDEPLMDMWPNLRPVIQRMNPDVFTGEEAIHVAMMGGATGWGKTHAALANNLYQVYLATCFKNPHRLFNLNKRTTPIVFMLMSVSGTITKRVLYQPFRAVFTNMRYSKRWLAWDKQKESELHLEGNILVTPALASLQSMVGQAIAGGIIDEINFMSIVENSKQVAGSYGQGGHYDQADIVFSNLTRRRRRSFDTRGVSIGTLCAPSSTRYKGDYLDRKMREAEEQQTPHILPLRYKQYDIAPQDNTAPGTFSLLVGTDNYPTRVLNDDDERGVTYPDTAEVEQVPNSYRAFFMSDPEGASRDILGLASNSITPFFSQRHKIIECILAGKEAGLTPFVEKSDVTLAADGMPQIIEDLLPDDREAMRFVHVDLASAVDRVGIVMVKYDGHTAVENPQEPNSFDLLPKFVVEMAVSIKPDSLNHADPAEVRKWVMQLATHHKLNIEQVSYDGWQSKESLGLLRQAGIASAEISVDKKSDPYKTLRSAIYEGRILLPDSDLLRTELVSLEYLSKKDKVDHPPKGSKDVADALCGAVYAASRNRLIRMHNNVVDKGGRQQNNIRGRRDMNRSAGVRRR